MGKYIGLKHAASGRNRLAKVGRLADGGSQSKSGELKITPGTRGVEYRARGTRKPKAETSAKPRVARSEATAMRDMMQRQRINAIVGTSGIELR